MRSILAILIIGLSVSQLFAAEDKTVTVYIMDNGVRADHNAFKGVDVETIDLVEGDNEVGFGNHGTLMAGLIVERAPTVKLISVRTLDEDESGSWGDFLKGVHWITNHHEAGEPAVANLSLGGLSQDDRVRKIVSGAIDQLVADGVTVVVAAGNDGEDAEGRIPSTLDSVISVGAVSKFNYRLNASNFGSCVDVYAKGENIRGPGSRSAKARVKRSGTSVAAAIVTGNSAAYLSANPEATAGDVKEWIVTNCEVGRVKNLAKQYWDEALLFVEP